MPSRLESRPSDGDCDRVAEGAPLLREYGGKTCIEGSNPSGSARDPSESPDWTPDQGFFIGKVSPGSY